MDGLTFSDVEDGQIFGCQLGVFRKVDIDNPVYHNPLRRFLFQRKEKEENTCELTVLTDDYPVDWIRLDIWMGS